MPPAAVGSGPAANWKMTLVVPADAVDLFADAFEPFALSVASFSITPDGPWTVEGYAAGPPDRAGFGTTLIRSAFSKQREYCHDCGEVRIYKTAGSKFALAILILFVLLFGISYFAN